MDTSLTAQPSDKEERKRRSGRPLECPESVVARLEGKRNLSVVERQELWLAKKNVKDVKAAKVKKRMTERANTAPDLSRSRQSFSALAKEKKMAAKVTADTRKRSSTAVGKRSITATGPDANPRSLGNITNQTETKRRKRQKMAPISDPFLPKSR